MTSSIIIGIAQNTLNIVHEVKSFIAVGHLPSGTHPTSGRQEGGRRVFSQLAPCRRRYPNLLHPLAEFAHRKIHNCIQEAMGRCLDKVPILPRI